MLEAAEQVRRSVPVGKGELSASQLLERLGLRGDRQWTPVGELSGGERRRLQLLMLLLAEPNVLLLDEPTNDLDIETLTELEDLLDGWPGSVVVVSHDRYFLERVTDHVLALSAAGSSSSAAVSTSTWNCASASGPPSQPPASRPAGSARRPPGSGQARRSSAGWSASSRRYPGRRRSSPRRWPPAPPTTPR